MVSEGQVQFLMLTHRSAGEKAEVQPMGQDNKRQSNKLSYAGIASERLGHSEPAVASSPVV